MFDVEFFKDKKILLTGHTGFKGTWLSLMFEYLGADVYGFALENSENAMFFNQTSPRIIESCMGYIQDKNKILKFVKKIRPEIIIHFASHSTLNRSDEIADYIFESNISGLVNLLEAIRQVDSVKSVLVVTSDKCYKNIESSEGYSEDSVLGAQDPYSTSKACQELLTECYRRSFFSHEKLNIPIATARASNVIGGGDYNMTRLFPYLLDCFSKGITAEIRNPSAIRPWQNVLDVLGGYLTLVEKLYRCGDANSVYSSAFNFGPDSDGFVTVGDAANILSGFFEKSSYIVSGSLKNVIETNVLKLDSTKAHEILKWNQLYSFTETLKMSAEFIKRSYYENFRTIAMDNIKEYVRGVCDGG